MFKQIDDLGLLQPKLVHQTPTASVLVHDSTTARNVTSRLVFDTKSMPRRLGKPATVTNFNNTMRGNSAQTSMSQRNDALAVNVDSLLGAARSKKRNLAAFASKINAAGGAGGGVGGTVDYDGALTTTAGFRSPCVSIQVALHELTAQALPKGAMPDAARARRLLELLRDTGTLCNDPIMSHVLHVLTLELRRCIFGPSISTIEKHADNLLSATAGSGSGAAGDIVVADASGVVTTAEEDGHDDDDDYDNYDDGNGEGEGGKNSAHKRSLGFGDDDDEEPYFDQLEEISREHRLLLAELNAVENTNRQDQMAAELERFRAVVPFYEHEISRLNREAARKGDESEGLREELASLQRTHDRSLSDFELQNKLLLKDVRELQVRLFQVSKSAIETEAGEEAYNMLKTTKAEQLHGLFEKCNERASVTLFLIQIEFLLNIILTRHDAAILNQPCRRWPHLVALFRENDTECLLEEYNELAQRRETLDAILPSAFADHKAATGIASADCSMRARRSGANSRSAADPLGIASMASSQLLPAAGAIAPPPAPCSPLPPPAPPLSSEEKSARAFGARLGPESGDPRRATLHLQVNVQAFHRNAVQPLLELTSAKRFRTSIEVHAETATGDEQMLRSVHTLNPLQTVKLPPRSQFVKLKFVNPMLKDPARNFGDDDRDLLIEDSIRSGANVLDWVPDVAPSKQGDGEAVGDESLAESQLHAASQSGGLLQSQQQQHQPRRRQPKTVAQRQRELELEQRAAREKAAAELEEKKAQQLHDALWEEFTARFGSYRPAIPRKLRIDLCDFHLSRAFIALRRRLLQRFQDRIDIALKSGAETLDSATLIALREVTESYSHRALQAALLEALEEIYVYPELVMKLAWEILSALEGPLQKRFLHVRRVYLPCLVGAVSPWLGSYIALINYKLGANWPQPTLREDDPAGSIPVNGMTALINIIFPTQDCLPLRPDQTPATEPFLELFFGELGAHQRKLQQRLHFQQQQQQQKFHQAGKRGGVSTSTSKTATFAQGERDDALSNHTATTNAGGDASSNAGTDDNTTNVNDEGNDAKDGGNSNSSSTGGGGEGGFSGITLGFVREFVNTAIINGEDPWSIKIGEVTRYYADESQWSLIDAFGSYESVKQLLVIDFANLRDQIMLHHAWTCGQMKHENRLPPSEVTRIVSEIICSAVHSAAIDMPAEIHQPQQ